MANLVPPNYALGLRLAIELEGGHHGRGEQAKNWPLGMTIGHPA